MAESLISFSIGDEQNLKFYFIIRNGLERDDVSNDMNLAYMNIKEFFKPDESIKWITESKCCKLKEFSKTDIFVLEKFEGDAFRYLKEKESLVIGPRCMISCLLENQPIPLGKFPIFTTAMRELYVCVSGLLPKEKEKIKTYVSWMGGYYFDDLPANCTHLVSNTVRSTKYEKAALNNIEIMHPDWVLDVWKRSQEENILATSSEFSKHKLPIFYNLNITSTGLSNEKRNKIKELVIDNGGFYRAGFQSKLIDILIVEKDGRNSCKFKAAKTHKKDCLLPDWIIDSVAKGFALPLKNYIVQNIKVSTPTKFGEGISAIDFNLDGTDLSEISKLDTPSLCSTINETCSSTSSNMNEKVEPRRKVQVMLDSVTSQDLKRAGNFLDGCRIYLSGFSLDEKEKLNKILNSGGAIRYEEMNENVTHVIVGESINQLELKSFQDQHQLIGIVNFNWLLESLKQHQPANENNFLFGTRLSVLSEPEAPSPSSKRTIESMNHSFKKPGRPKKLDFSVKPSNTKGLREENCESDENDLLSQYQPEKVNLPLKPVPVPGPTIYSALETKAATQDVAETSCTEDFVGGDFFEGLAIYVHEDDEEIYKQLVTYCEDAGGTVVSNIYKQMVDYIIVSSEKSTDLNTIPVKGKNIVNTLWLEEAMYHNAIVEEQYFHKLIPATADKKPLKGINIVISIYTSNEKNFLQSLISVLGAEVDNMYVRKKSPLLVCPSPEGAKYSAAIKWGKPVVRAEWLVECARLGEKVSLRPYLVGEAIVSENWNQNKSGSDGNESSDSTSNLSTTKIMNVEPVVENYNDVPKPELPVDNGGDALCPPQNTVLRHHRLSELMGQHKKSLSVFGNSPDTPARKSSLNTSNLEQFSTPTTKKPSTSTSPSTSLESSPLNISDFVKQYSTPLRECVYEVLKERENKETPPTQKLQKLVVTPGKEHKDTPKIPDFCTTPEFNKRRYAELDKYYLPKKERRHSTPLSEIKRKFWQQALGEHYWEPPVKSQVIDGENELFLGSSKPSDQEVIQNVEMTANENIKRLSEFIKNRESGVENMVKENEDDNEGILQKIDSEVGGTEQMVGWRDPSEFLAVRRSPNKMRYQGVPVFSISCLNDVKPEIIRKIKVLQGQICENLTGYDKMCTHIVCEKPNRGEKILSCIAAGKWVLSLKYIDDSHEMGHFLDEEEYEWGNPKASCLPQIESNEQGIANAAFRWRTKLLNSLDKPKGVFRGFRVILHASKKESYTKLLSAGGGIVLNVNSPYSKSHEALTATHCLVETRSSKLTVSDHKALKKAGVKILSVAYLNALLTSDSQSYSNYEINL